MSNYVFLVHLDFSDSISRVGVYSDYKKAYEQVKEYLDEHPTFKGKKITKNIRNYQNPERELTNFVALGNVAGKEQPSYFSLTITKEIVQ